MLRCSVLVGDMCLDTARPELQPAWVGDGMGDVLMDDLDAQVASARRRATAAQAHMESVMEKTALKREVFDSLKAKLAGLNAQLNALIQAGESRKAKHLKKVIEPVAGAYRMSANELAPLLSELDFDGARRECTESLAALESLKTVVAVAERQKQAAAVSAARLSPTAPVADEIRKLGALRTDGLITDAEFEAQKAKLLAQ